MPWEELPDCLAESQKVMTFALGLKDKQELAM